MCIRDRTSILKKFNEDLNNIKIAASGLLAGQKILTAARGSDWSPNTKKRLSGLSGVGRVFAARDIREGNIAAVRKGQRLQLMKNQQVLKKKATTSGNTFDPLTTDRLGGQYDVAPHGESQNYADAYSKALGKEEHRKSIRDRIRDHGFTTNAKRGLEVVENEKVYVDGITAEDLKARKVWCEEELPKLLKGIEQDKETIKRYKNKKKEKKRRRKKWGLWKKILNFLKKE